MSSIDEVSSAIGALQAQSALILRKAEQHDAETKLLQQQIQNLQMTMSSVEATVEDFRPIARKVRNWEQRAAAMSVLGGGLGGVVLAWVKGKGWLG